MMRQTVLRSFSLCFVLLLSSLSIGAGQESPDFLELQRAVALLMESPSAQQETTRPSVTEVRDRVEEIQALLEESGPSPDGQTAAAVHHMADVLREAARGETEIQSRAALDDLRRDLDLKIQYFRGRMGVAGATRGLVRVVVRTLRKGKPILGLVVYCNPYRWKDEARHMHTFPALSSPTETSILPGYYLCFASAGEHVKPIASRDAEIGLDGKDTLILEIPVP